jgi:GNAT superfamily N-acetyltransferase
MASPDSRGGDVRMEEAVDVSWCGFFGVDRETLHAPGIVVLTDVPGLPEYEGTFVLRLGGTCVIAVPSSREASIREAVEGRSVDEVFDAVFVPSLGREGWLVLGPSRHSYADRSLFHPVADGDVRRLREVDALAVRELEAAVPGGEWSEGGFVHEAAELWGVFEDDRLAALGNMTEWNGAMSDVGLVTRPDRRGRGLGTMVASAMCRAALETIEVVRYRALTTNIASLRVADRLGFVSYGENMAIRPA